MEDDYTPSSAFKTKLTHRNYMYGYLIMINHNAEDLFAMSGKQTKTDIRSSHAYLIVELDLDDQPERCNDDSRPVINEHNCVLPELGEARAPRLTEA